MAGQFPQFVLEDKDDLKEGGMSGAGNSNLIRCVGTEHGVRSDAEIPILARTGDEQ